VATLGRFTPKTHIEYDDCIHSDVSINSEQMQKNNDFSNIILYYMVVLA